MEVVIRPTSSEACDLVAALIADALRAKPQITLGLATGGTMERVYRRLVDLHRHQGLDFSLAKSFNLDEYVGLPADHPASYHHYMRQHLFDHVNIDPRNAYLPDGMAADLAGEGPRYEALIADEGGIDLQLLGLGRTGHIGFNEPLSAMFSRTRVKALTETTRQQNAPFFDSPEAVPRRAVTMGVGTILEAKRCLLLAVGAHKAWVVSQAVEGPVTSMISATALQLHPHCTVVVDEAAAADLVNQEYYRWIFDNEPEWEPYRSA